MRGSRFAFALGLALLALVAPSLGHRLAPSFLSLDVGAEGRVELLWKTPQVVARGARVEPVLPDHCRPRGEAEVQAEGTAWVTRLSLDCGAQGLIGSTLRFQGLEESGTDALLRLGFDDGREIRAIVSRESPSFEVPEKESAERVFLDYLTLGIEHLLSGLDHLLFVLGLMLLMPTPRKLVAGVTAFTVGHSITLALAVLGVVGLPSSVVEIAIAVTLVALAREALGPDPDASVLVRHPALAPLGFGLVHGLGFAGALAELGLPGHAIPLALFAFNVGIEIGQLGVVLVAYWAVRAWVRAQHAMPWILGELPATVIGTLGVFWCLARATQWIG